MLLAGAVLTLTACGGGDEAGGGTSPAPTAETTTSSPSIPSTPSPTATATPPVACEAFVDAVNAEVAPLLAAGDFSPTGELAQLCLATNDRGDELSVVALDLPDEGCLGETQDLPGLGRGSYSCVGEQQGTQVLQGTVVAEGATRSLTALVELAPSPELAYTTSDLAPVAATLARSLAGLTP